MSGPGSTDNFTVVSTRRIWSQSEKLLIVSEAVAPGASICGVARRHNLSSSLLYRWIKHFKADEPVQRPAFVPIALAPPSVATASAPGAEPSAGLSSANGMIEVVLLNGRILRIGADIDLAVLKRIAAALEDQA
jgi:transposase